MFEKQKKMRKQSRKKGNLKSKSKNVLIYLLRNVFVALGVWLMIDQIIVSKRGRKAANQEIGK